MTARALKVALVYAPPWKIGDAGAPPYGAAGPPSDYRPGDLDADFHQIPYGLLALAATVHALGHSVKVVNLSASTWPAVERAVEALSADVVALSMWTANRRGVAYVAELAKRVRGDARVIVGGPHASALPHEVLRHHDAIDAVCVGEADVTFAELLERVARGESLSGVAGAWVRAADGAIEAGPPRKNLPDLDVLPAPQRLFATHILMTSRGCPWACTFCGAETSWGRGFRAHSTGYVLDTLEAQLERLPVKMVQIKDDTFTTQRKRVLELCRGIVDRGLRFLWSCDTRVDVLDEELLRAMRLAGCERLSLGVESGSEAILKNIDKKITAREILASTALAKKYGIKVRYYMMLGNRGETRETFEETLAFLDRARPHEAIFSCLSIYPGTRDFDQAEAEGWLDRRVYFEETFQELKAPFDATDEVRAYLNAWFAKNSGLRVLHRDTSDECRAVLAELADHPPAWLDLGAALYGEGRLDEAEAAVRRALDSGHPCPGLCLNHLAVIAHARGDLDAMMDLFSEAARRDPQHMVLIENVQRARAWFKQGGPARGLALELVARHDFRLLERTVQPTLPGPLPDDLAEWARPAPPVAASAVFRSPEHEGSQKGLGPRGKLPVLP